MEACSNGPFPAGKGVPRDMIHVRYGESTSPEDQRYRIPADCLLTRWKLLFRSMRIAILAQPQDRIPSSGSLAVWTSAVATRLSKNHDVTVYTRAFPGMDDVAELDGVRFVRLDTRIDDALERRIRSVERFLSRLLRRPVDLYHRYYYFGAHYAPGFVRAAGRAMRRNGEDVAIVGNISQFLPILRRLCPKTRLALMMHCDWLIELPAKTVANRLKAADLVMGCSSYISEGVRTKFPRLQAPAEALHNGSSPDSLLQDLDGRLGAAEELESSRDKIVLFVGRITPEKGVHILIGAMRTVLDRVPNARLVIAGGFWPNPPSPLIYRTGHGRAHDFELQKPGYAESLESLALPFGDRVRFLSDIPHGQLGTWYDAADVFVHPALWDEPFGMILTEAMAFGCPVVSTRSGGIPEIVADGTTGLLVEPGDEQALGEAIARVLSEPDLAARMGDAGRARLASTFTWDRTAARLDELLSSIAQ